MNRLTTSLLTAVAAVGCSIALATPAAASAVPVTVHVGTDNGGVQVGASFGTTPLVGGHADNGGVCVGIGYQVPQCPIGTNG